MDNKKLIDKIKSISVLTHEEQAELINLLHSQKKYGLVWEDKFEQIEEDLLTNLPVLTEVKDRFIEAKPMAKPQAEEDLFTDSDEAAVKVAEAPNHILIEGDNLHALTALSFTHKGAIDVIYIDPPYNTGNGDFRYNDRMVDKEDSFRHSKWISFIQKRTEIAKTLLKETGVLFVSIDDNEFSQLRLLLDEIFLPYNYLSTIVLKNKAGAGAKPKALIEVHEYILMYAKDSKCIKSIGIPQNEKSSRLYNKRDHNFETRGPYGTWALATKSMADRPNLVYPIIHNGEEIWPEKQWLWSKDRVLEAQSKNELVFNRMKNGKWSVRFKQYLKSSDGTERTSTPTTFFDGPYTQDGTKELVDVLGDRTFVFPKPTKLIRSLLEFTYNNSVNQKSIILDFFAGSGTTLQATMQLNAEDGGNRQCILVTNNENNICEEVTYERNKRVIQGYTNAKEVEVAGLTNNNLRYYKCDYVPSAKTEANRRRLTEASTDLLCIKEDCYHDVTKESGVNPKLCRLYTNKSGKYLAIVYHSRSQHEVNERMCEVIAQLNDLQGKVKLYGFSPEIEVLLEDFFSVKDRVHAVPLPDAIYNAYRSTFKSINLGKRKSVETVETDSQVEETDLFNQATTEA